MKYKEIKYESIDDRLLIAQSYEDECFRLIDLLEKTEKRTVNYEKIYQKYMYNLRMVGSYCA